MKRFEHLPIALLALAVLAALGVLFRNLPRHPADPADPSDPATLQQPAADQEPDFKALGLVPKATDAQAPKIDFTVADSPRAALFPKEGTIEIDDTGFLAAYDEIYDNRDAYYGRSVVVSGYVEYQEGLGAGEFLVGRDLLWCCEDDMDYIGYLVRAEGTPPSEGSELKIEGILKPMAYYNEESKKTITVPGIDQVRRSAVEGLARIVYP